MTEKNIKKNNEKKLKRWFKISNEWYYQISNVTEIWVFFLIVVSLLFLFDSNKIYKNHGQCVLTKEKK